MLVLPPKFDTNTGLYGVLYWFIEQVSTKSPTISICSIVISKCIRQFLYMYRVESFDGLLHSYHHNAFPSAQQSSEEVPLVLEKPFIPFLAQKLASLSLLNYYW